MYTKKEVSKLQVAIVLLVLMIVFLPFLCFVSGWITGFLAMHIFGATLTRGLMLIGINVTPDKLPLLFGTIATVAGLFKSSVRVKEK